MKSQFPLFDSHLTVAHKYWQSLVKTGDIVIDATAGNGHDALFLAHLALAADQGLLYMLDIQEAALQNCRLRVEQQFADPNILKNILYVCGCHSEFPSAIAAHTVKLVVYNLGYLPGGDKSLTTRVESTLTSLRKACELVLPGGTISVTCYPGHEEGKNEQAAILEWAATLDPWKWSSCHHQWVNRKDAPSLLLLQKSTKEMPRTA